MDTAGEDDTQVNRITAGTRQEAELFLYMHFKDINTAAKRFLDSLKKLRCSEDDSYSSAQAMGFTCRSGAVKVQQVETHRVNQETVTLF